MRWEWYTDEAFELRPLWRERTRSPQPGRPLAQRPPSTRDAVRYGFDDRNRPVVMAQYSGFLNGRRTGTTTRTYRDDVIEEVAVDADGAQIYADRYEYADGLLRRWSKAAVGGYGDETYHYTDGRVTGIDVTHGGRPTQRIAVGYDSAGRLARIETTHLQGRSYTELTYQRPARRVSLAGRCRTVAALLVDRLPRVVAASGAEGPFYCLALVYYPDQCLPMWGLGSQAERELWLREQDEPDDFLWSPADFELFDSDPLDAGDPELHEAARLLDQELSLAGSGDRVRRLLLDVAHALNDHDWTGTIAVTDDFVVYPLQVHGDDLERNLSALRRRRGLRPG